MASMLHRLSLFLEFPEGLRPGAGKSGGNQLQIDLDGHDRPVLRGSAVAGVLRHAYARHIGMPSEAQKVSTWFGASCNANEGRKSGNPSPLRVQDMVFSANSSNVPIVLRHHNAMDRHWGAVRPNGLYDILALAPGVKTATVLWLESGESEAKAFLETLVGLLAEGLTMGGNSARGIGRVQLKNVFYRAFNLEKIEDEAAFLDEMLVFRKTGQVPPTGDVWPVQKKDSGKKLCIECTLVVPRGQDLCVGAGQGIEHDIEPQRVTDLQGKTYWLLPGSSLRGLFRAWVSRLAARDRKAVSDSHSRAKAHREPLKGDAYAWGFKTEEERQKILDLLDNGLADLEEAVDCPVMRLFGSCYAKGRIHIADTLVQANPDKQEQARMHVAVDRITGGATEGFLFSNTVLSSVAFPVRIFVEDPTEEETRYLAQTLRAIDMGILRVGSSKSGGRLALAGAPKAKGPYADIIRNVVPFDGGRQ